MDAQLLLVSKIYGRVQGRGGPLPLDFFSIALYGNLLCHQEETTFLSHCLHLAQTKL